MEQPDVAARVGIEAVTDDFPVFQKAQGDRHPPLDRLLTGGWLLGQDGLLQFVLGAGKGLAPFAIDQGEKEIQHL